MGLLPSAYFAVFVAFSAWSFYDDAKIGVGMLRITSAIISDAALICLALSYWSPGMGRLLGAVTLPMFGFACAGFGVQLTNAIRRQLADVELSRNGKLFVLTTGTGLVAIASAPLLYWAFSAAVLHEYAFSR